MGDVTMTATQAAAALGVSADTVRRRVRRGEFSAHRDGQGRLLVTIPGALQADSGSFPDDAGTCRRPAGEDDDGAGELQALQAELQALQAVLAEVRGERDALRQQVIEHAHERERWHERLREAHLLLAQRPALPAPHSVADPANLSPDEPVANLAMGPRPWWLRWWPWGQS